VAVFLAAPLLSTHFRLVFMHLVPYWRLSGYYFFYFAFIGAFSPYFGLFLQGLGFSAWQIALLLSQMQVMRVVAPILWGWLADCSGRRVPIVRMAAAVSMLGIAGFFVVEGFTGWLLAIALLAFFWSAALPLVETITLGHLQADPARYSRVRLWGSVGFIIAVMATGWWLDRAPMGSLLWVLFAMLCGILACALVLPEATTGAEKAVSGALRSALRQTRVRALLAACFMMSLAHGALYVFYSIYLAANGYSQTLIGLLWSLGVVAEIGVFLVMARLLERFSVRTILVACFAAAALRFLLIGWGVHSLLWLVPAQLLHALSFGAYHAAAIDAVNRWFPAACQGRGQALYSSLSFGAGGLVGGLISGAIWDTVGGAGVYTLSALAALLGGLTILRWTRADGEPGRAPA
jgi:MFS transporter, PPP family, 3-phenylpropionic acid transporter